LSLSKKYGWRTADTDQQNLFHDQDLLFECADLKINIDIKYFGWMKKDDE
jgi:hypothetical protein